MSDVRFRALVDKCLKDVRTLLTSAWSPVFASDAKTNYADKFVLMENCVAGYLASALVTLEAVGLTPDHVSQFAAVAPTQPVDLVYTMQQSCAFNRTEKVRETDHVSHHKTSVTSRSGTSSSSGVIKTGSVETYHLFELKIVLSFGVQCGADGPITPLKTLNLTALVRGDDETRAPYPSRSPPPTRVNIGPLLTTTLAGGVVARAGVPESAYTTPPPTAATRVVAPPTPAITFRIDQAADKCHTPSRNLDVAAAVAAAKALALFCGSICDELESQLKGVLRVLFADAEVGGDRSRAAVEALRFSRAQGSEVDPIAVVPIVAQYDKAAASAIAPRGVNPSTPIAPPTRRRGSPPGVGAATSGGLSTGVSVSGASDSASGAVSPAGVVAGASGSGVEETQRLVHAQNDGLMKAYREMLVEASDAAAKRTGAADTATTAFTPPLARTMVGLEALKAACSALVGAVASVEQSLFKALSDAVGGQLTDDDVDAFARHTMKKAVATRFRPAPLSVAVRAPAESPMGFVEVQRSGAPVFTFSRTFARPQRGAPGLSVALSAAASCQLRGPTVLHGLMWQRFSGMASPSLELKASARGFGAMVVLLSTVAQGGKLKLQSAVTLKDLEELTVPLRVASLPSAKEFKAATVSLSPTMHAFCQMYRRMQLSNTLFAFTVIHVRRQLEKVLRLPSGCMESEIELTQGVMQLVLQHQVNPDALSYDPASADAIPVQPREGPQRGKRGVREATPPAKPRPDEAVSISSSASSSTSSSEVSDDEVDARSDATVPDGRDAPLLGEPRIPRTAAEAAVETVRSYASSALAALAARRDVATQESRRLLKAQEAAKAATRRASISMKGVAVTREKFDDQAEWMYNLGSLEARDTGPLMGGPCEARAEMATASYAMEAMDMEGDMADAFGDEALDDFKMKEDATVCEGGEDLSPSEAGDGGADAEEVEGERGGASFSVEGLLQIPHALDAALLKLDVHGNVRSTSVSPVAPYTFVGGRFTGKSESIWYDDEVQAKTRDALRLLDALTRGGETPIYDCATHVVCAIAHEFDKSAFATVCEENINPAVSIEAASAVAAAIIVGEGAEKVLSSASKASVGTLVDAALAP